MSVMCGLMSMGFVSQVAWRDPMIMIVLGVLGVAALAVGLGNLIRDLRKQEDKRVDERLMGGVSKFQTKQKSVEEIRKSLIKKSAIAEAGGSMGKRLARFQPIDQLQKACYQADLDWNAGMLVSRMMLVCLVTFFVLMVLGVSLVKALVLSAVPFICPIVYVVFRRNKRLNALVDQLPEVFDALVAALRAGQSLPAAIGVVAEQLPEPARTEFAFVYHEQNLGVPMEDALTHMRQRLNQMDVSFFVTAVLVQKQSGGDLAEVLENIGEVIRARIKLFGQVRALTAEGRLSGWVLMALPPVMFLVLLMMRPDYVMILIEKEIGQNLLIGAAISQFFGLLMIKKIVTIEV